MSTRVYLPSGRVDRGRGLLDQAVWVADRHGLDGLLADALTTLSQLDETADRPVEALGSLHGARAADQRRLRATAQAARRLLTEANPAKWNAQTVNALLRNVVRSAAPQQQPSHDDWRIAAQRVTQPRPQASRSAATTPESTRRPALPLPIPLKHERPARPGVVGAQAGAAATAPAGSSADAGWSSEAPVRSDEEQASDTRYRSRRRGVRRSGRPNR